MSSSGNNACSNCKTEDGATTLPFPKTADGVDSESISSRLLGRPGNRAHAADNSAARFPAAAHWHESGTRRPAARWNKRGALPQGARASRHARTTGMSRIRSPWWRQQNGARKAGQNFPADSLRGVLPAVSVPTGFPRRSYAFLRQKVDSPRFRTHQGMQLQSKGTLPSEVQKH